MGKRRTTTSEYPLLISAGKQMSCTVMLSADMKVQYLKKPLFPSPTRILRNRMLHKRFVVEARVLLGGTDLLNWSIFPVTPCSELFCSTLQEPSAHEDVTHDLREQGCAVRWSSVLHALTFWWLERDDFHAEEIVVRSEQRRVVLSSVTMRGYRTPNSQEYASEVVRMAVLSREQLLAWYTGIEQLTLQVEGTPCRGSLVVAYQYDMFKELRTLQVVEDCLQYAPVESQLKMALMERFWHARVLRQAHTPSPQDPNVSSAPLKVLREAFVDHHHPPYAFPLPETKWPPRGVSLGSGIGLFDYPGYRAAMIPAAQCLAVSWVSSIPPNEERCVQFEGKELEAYRTSYPVYGGVDSEDRLKRVQIHVIQIPFVVLAHALGLGDLLGPISDEDQAE